MNKKIVASLVSVICVCACTYASSARAEDLNKIFENVNNFITQKNYTKALEELDWAKNEIGKMHVDALKGFFPDSLAGYNGGEVESSSALGMTNIERTYNGVVGQVKVSLVGGGKGGAMGGLAGLGRMAAMMGGQNGQESLRINGQTATLDTRSSRPELNVFLESGGILKVEGLKGFNKDNSSQLKSVAEAIKIAELNKYLSGAGAAS
ncbi:MAG: hypothetical protein KDD55_12580 [Bdellovibrionales bacterium]|nr:hypothetical protein [Bdellovibrionales bacterium]